MDELPWTEGTNLIRMISVYLVSHLADSFHFMSLGVFYLSSDLDNEAILALQWS